MTPTEKYAPVIHITPLEKRAKVKPDGFLHDQFYTYVEACKKSGTRYEPALKANSIHLDMIPVLVENLRLAGFKPRVDPAIEATLKTKAAESRKDVEAAANRIRATDRELKRRGLRLYDFQKTGVIWLAERSKALLADEMGLGKTIQALTSIPQGAPVIVTCPASLKGNWRNETRKWRPDLVPVILSGRGSWRWPRKGEIIIANYDILPETATGAIVERMAGVAENRTDLFGTEAPCMDGVVLIADEAHAVKNGKSLRTQRFKEISKTVLARGGRVWLLTGTPLLNRPMELWSILNVADLASQAFGSFGGFMRMFNAQKTAFGIEWGKPTPQVAENLKTVMLQRLRERVLPDLPTKTWRTIDVELDYKTRELCNDLMGILERNDVHLDHDMNEQELHRIEKIAFDQISKARAALARAKIKTMLELVQVYEDEQQPLVVFSAHREPIDLFEQKEGWATITGGTPNERRAEIVEAFQGGRLRGIACTIQAGGLGLTLTRANECIFVDLMWTPALNKQAEDRLCRIGQTRGVIVNRLIADHNLERRVIQVLHEKQMLIEGSVEKAAVGNEINEQFAQKYNL